MQPDRFCFWSTARRGSHPRSPDADACVRRCRLLIETAKRLDVPVVAIEQYPQGLGPTVPELAALLNLAQVHAKRHFSCAAEPRIVAALEAHVCPTTFSQPPVVKRLTCIA
jgi:hypothetical protein